jgi:hypothetical protein
MPYYKASNLNMSQKVLSKRWCLPKSLHDTTIKKTMSYPNTLIFYPEDGSRNFIDIDIYLPDYTNQFESKLRKNWSPFKCLS